MEINIKILGERLKLLRKQLGLRQEDVAQTLQVNQNAISRLENGVGGSLEIFLSLVNYYRKHFWLDNLLNDQFEVVQASESPRNHLSGVAAEKLKLMKQEMEVEIEKIIRLLDS